MSNDMARLATASVVATRRSTRKVEGQKCYCRERNKHSIEGSMGHAIWIFEAAVK